VATKSKIESVFPTCGIAGGWRDMWTDPDDHAELQARAEAPSVSRCAVPSA